MQLGAGISLFCLSQYAIPICTLLMLMNTLIFSIFLLNTRSLTTSILLLCYWRSMVFTYCCSIMIMLRSCSLQVGVLGHTTDAGCWVIIDNNNSSNGSNYL